MKETMEEYMLPCPLCNSKLLVMLPSVCLATSICIQCSNATCAFVDVKKLETRSFAWKRRFAALAIMFEVLLGDNLQDISLYDTPRFSEVIVNLEN